MNFIVVGYGRVGSEMAYRFFRGGHQVMIVDSNKDLAEYDLRALGVEPKR